MAVNINIPSQVKTFANLAAFPATGAVKTIYIAEDTNKTYRWTGSVYVEISGADFSGYVPTSRTLTINGTTQDLSADRTFTISTGLTVGTTPISSGTIGRVLFQGTGNVLQQSSSLFWDSTNNRLGIGTNTPTSAMQILGSTNVEGLLNITNNTTLNFANAVNILFPNTVNGNQVAGFYIGKALSSKNGWGVSYTHSSDGSNSNRGSIDFFGVNSILNWFASGNVAINTTTDAGFRLDVNGTARVSGATTMGSQLTIRYASPQLTISNAASSNKNWSLIMSGNDLFIREDGIGFPMVFKPGGNVIANQSGGNFLINTTTDAGFRLDVNGTARVRDAGSELIITSPLSAIAPVIFSTKGATGGYRGGYNFRGGFGGSEGNTIFIIDTGNTDATSRAGIGNFVFNDLASAKFSIDNTQSGGRNAAIRLRGNFANTFTEYNGIDFNAYTGTDIGGFIGSQRNTATSGFGADIVVLATRDAGPSTYLEIARFMGRFNSFYVGTDKTLAVPSAKLQVESTTQGFLCPRMTTTQKNAIASPATGLQVYDTTLNRPCFYDGTTWITL